MSRTIGIYIVSVGFFGEMYVAVNRFPLKYTSY